MTVSSFDEITTDKPEKSLTVRLTKTGGRNQQGKRPDYKKAIVKLAPGETIEFFEG